MKADIERMFGIGPENAGRLAEEFSRTGTFSKMERLARRAVADAEAGRYDPSRFPWLRLAPTGTRFQENPGKALRS